MNEPRWDLPAPTSRLTAVATERTFALGHPLVAQVLLHRGLVGPDLAEFLRPDLSHLEDPNGLRHMDAALKVLDEAVRSGRKITVYGDYDVDGTTATALLVTYLRNIGADADYFIPMRAEGYGVTRDSLDRIFAGRKPELLITVDCGTSSRFEVEYALRHGVNTLVTDHHAPTPGKETNGIIINPHIAGDGYLNKGLAGVGVAYKLVAAHYAKSQPIANLDLVAMGTIADVMPLIDWTDPETGEVTHANENRLLVRAGLERLAHSKRIGLQALLATSLKPTPCQHGSPDCMVCGAGRRCQHEVPYCYSPTAEDIAFQVGPRINAIGRMGLDPMMVVELFITKDESRAREIAGQLDAVNRERREVTNKLVDEALGLVDPDDPVIVLQMDLFKGVAGLVASKLTNEFNRPSIIIDSDGAGSARSVLGVKLLDVLQTQFSKLVTAAGHQGAMGISRVRDVKVLRDALRAYPWPVRERVIAIDAVCEPADLDMRLLRALRRLEPTGQANPAPVFAMSGLTIAKRKLMSEGRHVRLTLTDAQGHTPIEAIWFGGGPKAPPEGAIVDVAGRPALSYGYRDNAESVEFHVSDLRLTDGKLAPTLGEAAG